MSQRNATAARPAPSPTTTARNTNGTDPTPSLSPKRLPSTLIRDPRVAADGTETSSTVE
ncbi:hypothetical protein SCMU_22250 [Sinomonas cyclohexanicum]|uniref:Uncharacterized protein n=1 Tax=Sinomonas cyclohexanicum TaxID=322009 RepID=A0ABN6FI19_SINCY|nr:hypothetical protein SCMU_22250 [Corynebacterium cyclohexanicum]